MYIYIYMYMYIYIYVYICIYIYMYIYRQHLVGGLRETHNNFNSKHWDVRKTGDVHLEIQQRFDDMSGSQDGQ